jgi:hypothetical protein
MYAERDHLKIVKTCIVFVIQPACLVNKGQTSVKSNNVEKKPKKKTVGFSNLYTIGDGA